MDLPYISVACGRTDLRRVKLLPPDRYPHYSSPVPVFVPLASSC